MAKKNTIEEIKTPEKIHEELFACINCEFENECEYILPFPLNLCEKCLNFKKKKL